MEDAENPKKSRQKRRTIVKMGNISTPSKQIKDGLYVAEPQNSVSKEKVTFEIEDDVLIKCKTNKETITIPDEIEKICANTFAGCNKLRFIKSKESKEIVYGILTDQIKRSLMHTAHAEYNALGEYYNSFFVWNMPKENVDDAIKNAIIEMLDDETSYKWKLLTIDVHDLISPNNAKVQDRLPLISPRSLFVQFEEPQTSKEEIERLGYGVLHLVGLDKKVLQELPDKFTYHISNTNSLDGYGTISRHWQIIVDIAADISDWDIKTDLRSMHFSASTFDIPLKEYLEMKRRQGNIIE